jgi:lipopolysaccharide export system protein LptA
LRIAGTVLAIFVAAALLGGAAPPPTRSLTIFAERMDVDAAADVLTAVRVRLTDGRYTLTAPRMVLRRRPGVARLEGGVRGQGPEGNLQSRELVIRFTGRLELTSIEALGSAQLASDGRRITADRITLDPRTGVVETSLNPAVFVPPDIRGKGMRMTYRSRQGTAEVTGPTEIRTEQGSLLGRDASIDFNAETAVMRGPVQATFEVAQGTANRAHAFFREGRAVLEGNVRMRRGNSRLMADRVIVWYRENRIRVEGAVRMDLEEETPGRP